MEDLAEMDLPTELLRSVIQNMKIIFTVIFALIGVWSLRTVFLVLV